MKKYLLPLILILLLIFTLIGDCVTKLDYMEYANDGLAQAAYVSSGGYLQVAQGTGTRIGDMTDMAGLIAIFDEGTTEAWVDCGRSTAVGSPYGYAGKDWEAGVVKIITQYKIYGSFNFGYDSSSYEKTITIELYGSNLLPSNATDGTQLHTDNFSDICTINSKTYNTSINKSTAYRYHWVRVSTSGNEYVALGELEFFEDDLQCYSEDTIKEQGTYSLKGIALITGSLNETLTRTVSPTIDLSDLTQIKYDIRGSRTGSQIKIGIHDSGGTTEHTANVAEANIWQTETWDISGVSNANKDVINSIIITIVNADAVNTFYIDNMYAETEEAEDNAIWFGINL